MTPRAKGPPWRRRISASNDALVSRQSSTLARLGVSIALVVSLWLRVVPAWPRVFTPWGVDFQEPDAWFHLRIVHNLIAHFPYRSGFDPYALYPGGMNL